MVIKRLERYKGGYLLAALIFLLTLSSSFANDIVAIDGTDLSNSIDILYVDDSTSPLNIEQIQRLPVGMFADSKVHMHKPQSLDFSVWYRLSLNDFAAPIDQAFAVTVDNPTLDTISFYLIENGNVIDERHLGDKSTNDLTLDYVVPQINIFKLFDGTKSIYIHVQTNGASASPIIIEPIKDSIFRSTAQFLLLGSFLGVSLIMIIYNFFMFRGIGDTSYMNYIGYVFFACFTLSLINGFIFYILPISIAQWFNQHLMISHFCGLAFAIRFAISFLRMDKIEPWFINLGRKLSSLMFVFAASGFVFTEATLTPYYFAAVASVYCYAVILIMNCVKSKMLWVKYYIASWLPLFVGVGVGVAAFNGGVPYNFVTRNGAVLGVLAEICIMSVALMDRFRANEIDKEYRMHHDGVTGLPNSLALEKALKKLVDARVPFSLAVFEVPQAKEIIPALGIESANTFFKTLFKNVADYAKGFSTTHFFDEVDSQAEQYNIARISDSNFAILFMGELDDEALNYNFLTIQEGVSSLIEINGVSLSVSCVAGMVNYPTDIKERDKLLISAYQAIRATKNNDLSWVKFDQSRSDDMHKRFALAAELQKAIEDDDLELYHQPQIHIATGDVVGSELLLRWMHPEMGFIPPDYIIDIAEETGVIHQVTEWVIERGLSQHSKLLKLGFEHTVSINISGKDLNDNSLVAHILTTVSRFSIPPASIIFELTESATAEDPKLAKRILTDLYEQGFKIAIDDFGTGYSSLDYLSQLPFHELKIDKCFMNIDVSERNQTITDMTITLASRLKVKAVAEGIETEVVANMLKDYEGLIGQGYFYSKPMPFIEYMRWLQESNRLDLRR
ncbi:EAL domain-containing protein [Psychrosphaera sp. 1_MG-2023]|nr:EAL domain-containing protein [Psychrosphaera sp. 1_MG-2023]MDO6721466.1 EAL domain-containing protein [Psychrosphaera sp. 1_MG-2023]